MPSPRKTFDKADLLTFLTETDDEAAVGTFVVIRPSPTLFGETENTTHEVQAITEAFWCERYQLALVIQRARVTGGGANALPAHHPLAVAHRSGKSEPRVNMRYGGTSSQLVRWAVELAEEWRGEVGYALPKIAIDRTADAKDGIVDSWADGSLHFVPGPTHAEPEPQPEMNDDTTPTGETVDDVFAEHDGDEGEAQP